MIEIIKTNDDLRKLVDEILHISPKEIAMDTEFVRETTYWPDLCLIQMAYDSRYIIIDILAEIDLHLLTPILTHNEICKVFHSCRQDIEIFVHQLNVVPNNLFDTQVAAVFLGLGEGIGYDRMIQQLLNIKIDKTLQYTNWSKRPLSDKHYEYAIDDVKHLLKAYQIIRQRLEQMGRLEWAMEEMKPLLSKRLYQNDPADSWRRIKTHGLLPKHIAVLMKLAEWREKNAQEHNINRGQLFRDDILIGMAKSPPLTIEKLQKALSRVETVISKLSLEENLLALLQRPVEIPSLEQLANRALTNEQAMIYDFLKLVVAEKANSLHIPVKNLIHKDVLYDLALGDMSALDHLPIWQQKILGESLKLTLDGKLGLILRENCLTTIPVGVT